jgi:hypothetical protein
MRRCSAASGQARRCRRPALRQEARCRVLGVKTRFHGVAGHRDVVLRKPERLAGRGAQLQFDEIEAGDHLGHRMFHLKPRVHLHEIECIWLEAIAGIGDELHRAGADIAHRFGRRHGRAPHDLAHFVRHPRRRSLLDHLLVAPLQRAVALEQMNASAMAVGKNLDFDMPRPGDVFLDQHAVIAEGRLCFAPAALQRLGELSARSTRRIPLPPPPATALMSTGKPILPA